MKYRYSCEIKYKYSIKAKDNCYDIVTGSYEAMSNTLDAESALKDMVEKVLSCFISEVRTNIADFTVTHIDIIPVDER